MRKLALRRYGKNSTKKPPLIFIHGWGVDSSVWNEQVDFFSREETVITIDLFGHGESPVIDEEVTIDRCADAISNIIKEEKLFGANLVGWSLGAEVALRVGLKLGKNKIGSVTIVGGTPCYLAPSKDDEWAMPVAKGRYFEKQLKRDFEMALSLFKLTFFENEKGMDEKRTADIKELLLIGNSKPDEKSAMELLASLYSDDIREAVKAVAVDCLILHGERDMIVPIEVTKVWSSLLKSAEITIFKDCGHIPFLTQPAEFSRRLKKFLNKR